MTTTGQIDKFIFIFEKATPAVLERSDRGPGVYRHIKTYSPPHEKNIGPDKTSFRRVNK